MQPKTRNLNTQTEAAFFSHLRSALRRTFRWWKPAIAAKQAARQPYQGDNKRQKWVYQCKHCHNWFKGAEVQIDHIIPTGQLNRLEDIPGFIKRLTVEDVNAYQILCKPCHKKKSAEEKIQQQKKN